VWVLFLGFFMFLSAVCHAFSLVLDPGGEMRALGGKAGSVLVRNFRIMRVVY